MGPRDPPSPSWEGDRDRRRSDLGRVALNHTPASSLLHPIIPPPLHLPFCASVFVARRSLLRAQGSDFSLLLFDKTWVSL
uniref:Uncharacterized protein n=1 Tax=Fagus sylvatica TaxID=28930 RepID=A0A2N9FGA1_FAGSY